MAPAVEELVKLTIDFIHAFAKRKKEDRVIDFNDMEHFALAILTSENKEGEVVPSKVAEELREYYQEIMTDEYQDQQLCSGAYTYQHFGRSLPLLLICLW